MSREGEEDWESAQFALKDVTSSSASPTAQLAQKIAIPVPVFRQQGLDSVSTKPKFPHPVPVSEEDDEIDSAVLDALYNPQERIFVLQKEHEILQFVKSKDATRTVTCNCNAYRRMLFYRVAQRFRLSHVADKNERITFSKTSDVSIPRQLLVDLPIEASSGLHKASSFDSVSSADNGNGELSSGKNTQNGEKKVVMMKRHQNSRSSDKKKNAVPTTAQQLSQVVSHKEKQYNEAKARIFNGEVVAVSSHSEHYSETTVSVTQRAAVSNAHGAHKKAMERDRNADGVDPDFVRGHSRSFAPSAQAMPPQQIGFQQPQAFYYGGAQLPQYNVPMQPTWAAAADEYYNPYCNPHQQHQQYQHPFNSLPYPPPPQMYSAQMPRNDGNNPTYQTNNPMDFPPLR